MFLEKNKMSQKIVEKYLLDDLNRVLYNLETNVIERVETGKLLGKADDVDLLVPSLTTSLSLLRQIIFLCENGFPDGALILARNIYEQMIICSFIEGQDDANKHDEFLEKYFQDKELTRLKFLNEQAKRFKNEADIIKTDRLIKEHNKMYGSTFNQYWWANKKTFRELSDEITKIDDLHHGLFNNMHMEYKMACIAMHPSSFGNQMNIGSSVVGVDMRARDTGHEHALFLAISSLITIVGYTYYYLDLNDEIVLSELNRLGIHYLKLLQQPDCT